MRRKDPNFIPFTFKLFFERVFWTYLSYGIIVAAVTLLAHLAGPE